DDLVTGVQTCALPISYSDSRPGVSVFHRATDDAGVDAGAPVDLAHAPSDLHVGEPPKPPGGCAIAATRTPDRAPLALAFLVAAQLGRASCRESVPRGA